MPNSTPRTNQNLAYRAHAAAISGKLCPSYLLLSPAKPLVQDSTACLRIGLLRGLAIVAIAMESLFIRNLERSRSLLVRVYPRLYLGLILRGLRPWLQEQGQVHGEKEKRRNPKPSEMAASAGAAVARNLKRVQRPRSRCISLHTVIRLKAGSQRYMQTPIAHQLHYRISSVNNDIAAGCVARYVRS